MLAIVITATAITVPSNPNITLYTKLLVADIASS